MSKKIAGVLFFFLCSGAFAAELNVQTLIDGRSQLVIQGGSILWRHYDFSPPGLHDDANAPTVLNGADWFPEWPGDNPGDDCRDGCESAPHYLCPKLTELDNPVSVQLNSPTDRGTVTVIQQPSAANDYTAIVEINDNGPSGSATYDFDITYDDEPCRGRTVTFTTGLIYPDLDYFQGPDVEATVACNSGSPLMQSADAGHDDFNGLVLFTVTDVPEDFMTTCTVTYGDAPEGFEFYVAFGDNSFGSSYNNEEPVCTFTDDAGLEGPVLPLYDENDCGLVLIPAPFDFEVVVDWSQTPDADPNLGQMAQVVIGCNNIFDWGPWDYTSTTLGAAPGYTPPLALTSVRPDPDAYYTTNPEGFTWCGAFLFGAGSAVEVDNDECDMGIPINSTTPMPECTIVATAWYEGIPTLSRYGMAIMALLMLGLGLVGFRRLV